MLSPFPQTSGRQGEIDRTFISISTRYFDGALLERVFDCHLHKVRRGSALRSLVGRQRWQLLDERAQCAALPAHKASAHGFERIGRRRVLDERGRTGVDFCQSLEEILE